MFKSLGVLFVIMAMLTNYAIAATFTSPTTKVFAGAQDVSVQLTLDTQGDLVSGLDSTMQFDSTKLVFAGLTTALPNKSLQYNEVGPGQVKFIVYGLNADELANDTKITAIFNVLDGVSGDVIVTFVDTHGATPTASAVAVVIEAILLNVVIHGDIDLDGFVNTQDVMLLARHLIGLESLTLEQGDIDSDGVITIADLQALINIVLE